MRTIGFVGSGNIGSQLARLAVKQGYDVVLSNSRDPETLQALIMELGGHARAATPAEAAKASDVVVVSIPLKNYADVPVEELRGKTVIDTMNYYPQRDGNIAELDDESLTTSELLQNHLPDSHVVKAFNNIAADHLTSQATPAGTPNRRALPIAGNDAASKELVTSLIREFGFDVVNAGPLAEGWRWQRDTPAYVKALDTKGLEQALANAVRYADMP
ncbi:MULTISPECIES: NADPH-dependent F420 reductase [unclassified Arthrobacter]|uniref:NADPH-dependent F420 reductase n=1 Tax=unclassified Arthrobacter TaxID=235627 RepID=UPI002103484D|nr:NADPH-dependent F420 reductase [Arthrobacter sp. zg-Y1116]MCQ1987633.1 NADPH-dependent F420 reductase [Arthrobacter sp. zg-Y844]